MRGHFPRIIGSICFFFVSIANPRVCYSLSPDGLAVLSLKSAIVPPANESFFLNWNESDPHPCTWNGIQCTNISDSSNPRVIAISIGGKNLRGYIPSEIGNLQYLRRLNLHGNNLYGSIPDQLLNATSLRSIFLYDNNLSGSLPLSIEQTIHLQHLDLSNNSLSGSIPSTLKSCMELQHLCLFSNKFTGEVPRGLFSAMMNLVRLDISSNGLTGFIPPDIGELKSLTGTLNLSFNHFSGPIPKTMADLPVTLSFDLRRNNLTGEIPQMGTFADQGPTAFLDNPSLCGFPLRKSCLPHSNDPNSPHQHHDNSRSGLSPRRILMISVASGIGIAIIGVLMVIIYWKRRDNSNSCSCRSGGKLGNEGIPCSLFCFSAGNGNTSESEEESGKRESERGGELVAIDKGFTFELDELLRASAYVLGKSGSGIVYKVVLANGCPVAVRRLGEGGEHRYKEFAAEVQSIARVKHPNVVRLRAYYWAPDEKLIITDYISNGNLASALHGPRPGLSWATRLRIANGVARGLAYLHEYSPRKFVHGDIKPTNILLNADFHPLISDFGLDRLVSITGCDHSSAGGFLGPALPRFISSHRDRPACYWPPEASAVTSRPTQKWDVFSFGIIMLEMLTGKATSTGLNGSDLPLWVRTRFEQGTSLSDILDPILLKEVQAEKEVSAVFQLALACTLDNPDNRPKMKTVSDNLDRIRS